MAKLRDVGSEDGCDVRERVVEAGGKELHPCNCAKCDERNDQGIFYEVLAFFPHPEGAEVRIQSGEECIHKAAPFGESV
jgi:hypothetical protein